MFNWLKKRKKRKEEEEERLEEEWYEKKCLLMEQTLGAEHDIVMHALIPYELGGGLDLYYYPNGVKGTGVATKELTYACRDSSRNAIFDKYELVMYTDQEIHLDDANDENTSFGKEHSNINAILNCIAAYSSQAELNPNETCEFPEGMETVGGKCLIFDRYETENTEPNDEKFGVMLIIEVFRDEMNFAMENGGEALLTKLKEKGIYPYSNLNRDSVLSQD